MEKIINDLFDNKSASRYILEKIWYRNILYYMGEQWLKWLSSSESFIKAFRYRPSIPTPVSNIIRDHVNSVKAMILNQKFKVSVWPNSNDTRDISAAELAENILADMEASNDNIYLDEKEDIAMWLAVTGNGFMRDIPEKDMGGLILGSDNLKKGEVVSHSLSPFNVFPDNGPGKTLKEKKCVGIQSLKDIDWIKNNFPSFKEKKESSLNLNYEKILMNLVASVSPWKSASVESNYGNIDNNDLIVFREIEFAPTDKYPEGRYVCWADGQILCDEKRLPIKVENGKWYYTLEDFKHLLVPGRFWGDSAINDLISPQNTINKIDQALEMNRRGIGRPTVVTPADLEFKRKTKEDASFIFLTYNAKKAGGLVPSISHGVPLPRQVLDERYIQKDVAQDASGDPKGILRGKTPTSSASGFMVDILRETATQVHIPMVERFYRSIQRSCRKRLIIAQELYSEKRLMKIKGADGKIMVKFFKGADLFGNTDVKLELVSGISSTRAGKVQTILNLVSSGFFNPQLIDEKNRVMIMKMIGLADYVNEQNPDRRRAEIEIMKVVNGEALYVGQIPVTSKDGNILMENGPEGPRPVMITPIEDPLFEFDNHFVHYEVMREFVVSQKFNDLSKEGKKICIEHLKQHQLKIQEADRKAQMIEAEMKKKEEEIPPNPGEQKIIEPVPDEVPFVETTLESAKT